MLLNELEPRDRQLLRALLVLGVVALALVVGSQIISAFYFFGDIILVFFLAWLIAFVISPVVMSYENQSIATAFAALSASGSS